MNLILYDYDIVTNRGRIPLPRLTSFKERIDHINENIFDIERYNDYYTQDKNRWLGIKVINKPNKIENVKHTLDFIAGYLLNSREYTTHDDKKEYLELLSDSELNQNQLDRLKFLEGQILYKNKIQSYKISKNMIFMKNRNYENLLYSQLSSDISKDNVFDYTLTYCLKKSQDDWVIIHNIKNELDKVAREIKSLKDRRKNIKQDIATQMEDVKDDCGLVYKIIGDVRVLKDINERLGYLNKKIQELYDDYLFVTENKVSGH